VAAAASAASASAAATASAGTLTPGSFAFAAHVRGVWAAAKNRSRFNASAVDFLMMVGLTLDNR
jgi:non-ribosomal peptide synthetase component F